MGRDYWWYDSDDGQDIWKKVNFAAKLSALAALPVYAWDAFLFSHPRSIPGYAMRFCAITVPFIGTATMFAFTTQILCREVPKMDPKWSYAIGGAAAGTVIGAARRSPAGGLSMAVYFGLLAPVIRYGSRYEQNWDMFWEGEFSPAMNDVTTDTLDLSLSKPRDLGPPASFVHKY